MINEHHLGLRGRFYKKDAKRYFIYSETNRKEQNHSTFCLVNNERKEYSQTTTDDLFDEYYTLQNWIDAYTKRFPDAIFLGEGEITK